MLKASKNVQIIPINVLFVTDNQNLNSGSLRFYFNVKIMKKNEEFFCTYRRMNGRNSSLDFVGNSGPVSSVK